MNELRGTSRLTVQEGLYLYATIKFNDMMLCMHHIKIFCLKMGMVDAPAPELYRHLQGLWRNRDGPGGRETERTEMPGSPSVTQERREKNDSRRSGEGIKSEGTHLKVADSSIDT